MITIESTNYDLLKGKAMSAIREIKEVCDICECFACPLSYECCRYFDEEPILWKTSRDKR